MHTLQDWPRNEAFSFSIPTALMSMSNPEITDVILRVYREWRLRYSPLEYFPWGELAHGIEWRWWDKTRAPLPRRLSAKLYDKFKYKLSSKFWGELGNMLRERIPQSSELVIRLSSNFDWKAGTFGDDSSCMWDNRGATRRAMAEQGKFLALQFFSPTIVHHNDKTEVVTVNGRNYYSHARCWVYPTQVSLQGTDEYVVLIFNSYGGIPLASIAITMQGLIDGEGSKQISVSNNGRTSGGIYVNSGSGRLIGSEAALKIINHLDFSFKNSYDTGPRDLRRRGAIVSVSGAILNQYGRATDLEPKAPKKFCSYTLQRKARENALRSFHNSQFNKYANNRKLKVKLNEFRVTGTNNGFFTLRRSRTKLMTQKQFIKMSIRGNYGYRGSTMSANHMFDINRSRLSNITGWHPSLEQEFPRLSYRQRKDFSRQIIKHGYNIWTYMTHRLSQLIKEV